MKDKIRVSGTLAATLAVTALIGFAAASCQEKKDVRQNSTEASVTTNENGSVSRSYTEMTVSTNGSMVTEHRRETRTTLDADGNVLASTTSEYAQSYPVGDEGMQPLAATIGGAVAKEGKAAVAPADAFLGLKFGEVFAGTNLVADADEPTLLRATFAPKKALAGFDDYYVYVTPKTHKVVKVYACAKEAVDAGASWRRNYLVQALEKRYQTWARPRSWCRPVYSFDIGSGRYVTAYLDGATRDYATIVCAWDEALLATAAEEAEAIRVETLKSAAERRRARVRDAADAF